MKQFYNAINAIVEPFKMYIDFMALGVTIAAIAKWVPAVAGLFSIAWLGTQLYDYWFVKRKARQNGNLGNN